MGEFKSRLREVVDSKGIKYKFIYDTLKINKSTMTDLLNGNIPTYKNAYRISKLIDVPMEEIWFEEE